MTQSYIDPSKTNFEAFKDLPRDQPIHMLNLLQYRDQAEYPEGHDNAGKDWSGRRPTKSMARPAARSSAGWEAKSSGAGRSRRC